MSFGSDGTCATAVLAVPLRRHGRKVLQWVGNSRSVRVFDALCGSRVESEIPSPPSGTGETPVAHPASHSATVGPLLQALQIGQQIAELLMRQSAVQTLRHDRHLAGLHFVDRRPRNPDLTQVVGAQNDVLRRFT